MPLSSLIVQRDVATMRQVEEALARQVIYGGDLVTNLLEVARVDEAVLTPLLAESMQLTPAAYGELPLPSDSARALIPADLAVQCVLVPLQVEGGRLFLAVAEPLSEEIHKQLVGSLGMSVEQLAAPAVRVWEAIARTYGVELDRRMQRLLGRLSGEAARTGSLPPIVARTPAPSQRRGGPPTVGAVAQGSRSAARRFKPQRRLTWTSFPEGQPTPSPLPPPVASRPALTVPSATPIPARVSAERHDLLQRNVTPSIRISRRRRGPLTLDGARREAEEADDRDTLIDLFFDFSRQFFDYAALFLVQGDIAEGRDAFGAGALRERVLGIGVPLDLPSLLSSARDKRAPVVARAEGDGLDAVLLSDLQRPGDAEIAVVPLVVRTRAVALLVGDCADAGIDRDAIQQVFAYARVVGKGFERLIVRRKLEGFVAGSRASGEGGGEGRASAAAGIAKDLSFASSSPSTAVPSSPESPLAVEPPLGGRPSAAPSLALGSPLGGPWPESSDAPIPSAAPSLALEPPPGGSPSSAPSLALEPPLGPMPSLALEPPLGLPSAASPSKLESPPAGSRSAKPSSGPEVALAEGSAAPTSPVIGAATLDSARARADRASFPPSSAPPPAMNIASVRPVSGPPIPREEPDFPPADSRFSQGASREAGGSHSEGTILSETTDPSAAKGAQSVRGAYGIAAGTSLGSGVVVPPHRPAIAQTVVESSLPSVIIDIQRELAAIVDRLIRGETDDQAEGELLRQGVRAMTVLMDRFPGPVTFERARLASIAHPPRASECGPVLRLVARERKVALPFVLERLADSDPEARGWATYLLAELPYVEALVPLLERLRDDDASTRVSAGRAIAAIARACPERVIGPLRTLGGSSEWQEREAAMRAFGSVRDAWVVPDLILGLRDDAMEVVAAAHVSLVLVTRQDYGTEWRAWSKWWEQNSARHRFEWLIDALTHDASELRRAAGEELRALSRQYFGYASDLPARDRERAQQRYRDWWITEGRLRQRHL